MALPPKFAGQAISSAKVVHTVEIYLDYVCPYSAKIFKTVNTSIAPRLESRYPNVRFIFRQQIQPWHPSSTLCHEAGAAVLQLAPEKFWPFSAALFEAQKEFFDVNVVNETRNKTYERLAKVAAKVDVDEKKVFDLLKVPDQPGKDGSLNLGNGVTNDVKFMVKAARATGVHVTPTVVFNGVVESSISSSFTAEQWHEWLDKNTK